MVQVSWKQIDQNGNGYVDGNEAQDAKQIGVKNIWNHMTEQDYNCGMSREQKLSILSKIFSYTSSSLLGSCTVMVSEEDENYLKGLEDKEEALLKLYNEYTQYKNETSQELVLLDAQIDFVDYKMKGFEVKIKEKINDYMQLFNVTSDKENLDKMQKLIARRDEINNTLREYEHKMRVLDYSLKD